MTSPRYRKLFPLLWPLWAGPPWIPLYATWQDQVVTLGATARCARSGAHPWPLRWEVTVGRELQSRTDQRRGLGRGDMGLEEPLSHTETHPASRYQHPPCSPGLAPRSQGSPCNRHRPYLGTPWPKEGRAPVLGTTHNEDYVRVKTKQVLLHRW